MKYLIVLFLVFLQFNNSFSQAVPSITLAHDTLFMCQPDTFQINFNNNGVSGTFGVGVDFSNLELDSIYSNSCTASQTYSGILYTIFYQCPGSSLTQLDYSINSCSIIPSGWRTDLLSSVQTTNQHFMLFQLVGANWVPYTGTYSFNGNSVTNSITLTFDLFFPFFTNIDFQDMYQIRGDAFSRNFIFTNNGGTTPGDFSGYIRFSDSLYCPAIQIDSIQFRIGNYTFPPRLYTPRSWISQDLDTLVVSSGGNIEVKEYLHINGCLDLCNSGICESVRQADTTNISKYQLEWGCDSAHLCKVVGSCSKISRNLNKVASLKLSRVAPAPDSVNFHQGVWENSCPGEITEWVFRLKNEGGANAYDIQWDLNKGYQDAFVLLVNSTTTLDSIFLTGTNGNYFPAQIHEVPSTFHSHCTDTLSILQSLDSCVISIAELKAGDFVDFHFSTIRCCPSDTFLLNTGIAFNKLKMQIIAFHECSVNGTDRVTTLYSPQDSGLFAPFSNITSNKSISLNGAELPDIRLTQSLFPSTSDLTGITHPNPDCNRAAYSYYRIQTTSFLPLDKYTGAIVASTYNADDDSILLTGRLKVHFQLQPGLQLSQPLGVNPVQFSSVIGGINYQWPPVPGSIVDTCNPVKQSFNVYNFEFDLDSIPLLAGNHNRNSLKNFREFINESGIDFYMNACCCTDLGRNFYTISVFFNANPNSCSTCWMPLSETGNEVNVHCPGCTTPGIIVDNYSLIRSYDAGTNSYGLQDTDDNGRADGVQTHSQIDSTYLSNHPQVRKNFSIQGDYLKSTLSAHFVDGVYQLYDSTINQEAGCTLAQWMRSTGDTLDHLYLDQNIPWSNPDKFNLQVHASSLRIIRTNPSLPQLPQTLSGSLTYIDINLFSPVNLITSPDADTSHKDFFYALSINNLRGNNSSLPSNYMFMPGDSFYLSTTYRVCNNFNNYNNESNGDADFCRHESDIVNYMYLTGTSQNYGAALGTPNWAGDTWTACTTCDSTDISTYLPPTCLFKCQTYGGYHFFLDIQSTNQLFIYRSKLGSSDNDKCSNRFYINSSVRIGGNANNVFPFEFRPAFTPDSIYIHVPPNYTITDGSAGSYFSTFHEGCVNHKSTISRLYPVNQQYRIGCVSTDTCSTVPFYDYNSPPYRFRYTIVDEDSLFNSCGDGCIGSPPSELANCRLDTTLALGDESFFQSTYVELSSACSDSLYVEYFDSTIVQVLFPDFSCQGGTHLESVANQTGLDSLVNAHPVLAFNTSTTPTAYSDSVCWDLTLSNISTTDDAHSAFIYLPPPTSDFEFTWTGFSSSGSTGNTIGFNSLGSILKSSFKQYRLCGRLKNCVPGEVQIYYGWNCDTLLDSLGNMCFSAADTLSYSIATSSPQATLSFPPNYYLCSSSTFEIDIQNSNTGTFSIDSIQILSVPHAVINPLCSLKYTKGAYVNSDTISLTGTNMLILSPFNRSNAFFAHDSVSGIGLTEHAILSFSFTPECNFVSDSLPLIAVFTTNYCGESDTIYPVPDSLWVQSGDSCSPGCSGLIVNLKTLPLICAGDSVNLEATVSGGVPPYSYLWTSAGFSSTLSSPSVAPTSTTTYTLQVTDASVTPLSGSGSVVLSVINNNGDCCIPSTFRPNFDYDLSNISSSQFLATMGSDTISTSNIILINGTFTVDSNIVFISCSNIVMGPNAIIDVLPGVSCSIISSTVQACSEMWQSIKAESGAWLFIGDSHINDGIEAVYSTGTPDSLTIKGNFFNRNYVSIQLYQGDFIHSTITGNTFSCSTTLKSPHSGKYTDIHIQLEDAKHVSIGDKNKTRNFIYDAMFGIKALRSDFKINNNSIGNNYHPNPFGGIYASGLNSNGLGSSFIADIGIDSSNSIEDIAMGIFVSTSYVVNIRNNNLQRIGRGINVIKCISSQIHIEDNKLDYFRTQGIIAANNYQSEIYIESNRLNENLPFVLTEESRKGIYINNASQTPSTLNIRHNFIANCRDGIQVMNQQTGTIQSNRIISRVPDAEITNGTIYRHGILLQGSSTSVDSNLVLRNCTGCTTDNTMNTYLNGITLNLSNSYVHDNYVKNVPTAVSVVGNCYLSNLSCNVLDSCQQGFLMVNDSLQSQGDSLHATDNQWLNWLGSYKLEGTNSNFSAIPWYYDGGSGTQYDPNPFDGSVIFPRNGISTNSCLPYVPSSKMQKDIYNLVIDSLYSDSIDENKYQDLITAYETLRQNLQLLYSGTVYDASLQNFFSLKTLENIGILSDIKEYLYSNDQANALLLNNNLSPENLMEANSQYVNGIVIESEKDTIAYDETEKANLESIAYQLPITGGEAVFRARAILNLDIDDSHLAYRQQHFETDNSSQTPCIYPNPNKGKFAIRIPNNNDETVFVSLYTSSGVKIKIQQIAIVNNQFFMDLSGLDSGIYLLGIAGRTECAIQKLVILK